MAVCISSITPHVPHSMRWCWECKSLRRRENTVERSHPSGLTVFVCAKGCATPSDKEGGE